MGFIQLLIFKLAKANNLRERRETKKYANCLVHQINIWNIKIGKYLIKNQEDNAMMKNVSFVMELLFPESWRLNVLFQMDDVIGSRVWWRGRAVVRPDTPDLQW